MSTSAHRPGRASASVPWPAAASRGTRYSWPAATCWMRPATCWPSARACSRRVHCAEICRDHLAAASGCCAGAAGAGRAVAAAQLGRRRSHCFLLPAEFPAAADLSPGARPDHPRLGAVAGGARHRAGNLGATGRLRGLLCKLSRVPGVDAAAGQTPAPSARDAQGAAGRPGAVALSPLRAHRRQHRLHPQLRHDGAALRHPAAASAALRSGRTTPACRDAYGHDSHPARLCPGAAAGANQRDHCHAHPGNAGYQLVRDAALWPGGLADSAAGGLATGESGAGRPARRDRRQYPGNRYGSVADRLLSRARCHRSAVLDDGADALPGGDDPHPAGHRPVCAVARALPSRGAQAGLRQPGDHAQRDVHLRLRGRAWRCAGGAGAAGWTGDWLAQAPQYNALVGVASLFGIIGLAMIGIAPIVSLALMVGLLSRLAELGVPILTPALGLMSGFSIAMIFSSFGPSTLILARFSGSRASEVVFGWNGRFVATVLPLLLILLLVTHWLQG